MTTLSELADYVTARQADPQFIATADKQSAFLNKMLDKKVFQGGLVQNFSIKNDDQASNFEWFLPDESTDVIGGGSVNTYTKLTPIVSPSFAWSYGSTNLVYSKIQLDTAKSGGESQLANYLDTRLQYSNSEMVSNLGRGVLLGTGDGKQSTLSTTVGTQVAPYPTTSVGTEAYGLVYQDRYFSGASSNTANSTTNLHFGKERHLYDSLVSNVFDASSAGYATAVSFSTATVTNGSTEVSVAASDDYSDYIGFEVWIDTANGTNYQRLNRVVVADAAAGAATTFQMSQVYRGATDAAVSIQLRPRFNTATHQAAGLVCPEKLSTVYFSACNGSDEPDLGLCDNQMFSAMYNDLFSNQRWTIAKNSDYQSKGYNNFMFHNATIVMDLNAPAGSVHFINTKYTKMYCLEGYGDYRIQGSDFVDHPTGVGHKQIGAAKEFAFQLVSQSPRSNARIINLDY